MARPLTYGERYTFQKIAGSTAIISDSTDSAEKSNNYVRSNTMIITGSNGSTIRIENLGTTIDPQIRFRAESDSYTIGVDNSQNNDFAISQTTGLPGLASANTVVRIPQGTGDLHVRNNLAVTSSIFSPNTLIIQPSGSSIDLNGGLIQKTKISAPLAIGSNYTVQNDDTVIYLDASAGVTTKTVTLPIITSDNDGRIITVIKTDASANSVQLVRSSTDTINGATTKTANGQYESITIIANSNVNVWYILNEYPAGSWI
jgi:hypothetical protein